MAITTKNVIKLDPFSGSVSDFVNDKEGGALYSKIAKSGNLELFFTDNRGVETQISEDGYLHTANSLKRVGLWEQEGDPTPKVDKGFVYTKDASGITELFYMDSSGNITQLTQGGVVTPVDRIISGNTKAQVRDTGSDGYFFISTEGTEKVRVNKDGYMGIGKISPTAVLDVVAVAGTDSIFNVNNSTNDLVSVGSAGIVIYHPTTVEVNSDDLLSIQAGGDINLGSNSGALNVFSDSYATLESANIVISANGVDGYVEIVSAKTKLTTGGKLGLANTSPSALLTLGTAGTTAGTMSLAGATSGVVTLDVAAEAGTWTMTLPANDGGSGQFLQTDGDGNCVWADSGSTITKYNFSETASDILTVTNGSNAVVGAGNLTIQVKKASAAQDGYLGKDDFTTFSSGSSISKGDLTESTSNILTISGGTDAVFGSGTSIQVAQAGLGQSGYLSSGDWSTFNGKQDALSFGDISETASGVLTITNGTDSTVGPNVTIQVARASDVQDGYLAKGDFSTFSIKDRIYEGNTKAEAWDTGSDGYFFVVTEGTEKMRIATDGKMGLGTSTPAANLDIQSQAYSILNIGSAGASAASIATLSHSRGTLAVPVKLNQSDTIGVLSWFGYGDTAFKEAAAVYASAASAFSDSSSNGDLILATTSSGTTATEKLRLTSGGRIGLGTTAPNSNSMIHIKKDGISSIWAENYNDNAAVGSGLKLYHSRGTISSPADTQSGDLLGFVEGGGYQGSGVADGARISFYAAENWTGSTYGSYITFNTTTNGAILESEKVRIDNSGKVGIMNTSPSALLTLGTAGTTAGTMSLAGVTSGVVTVDVAAEAGTWTMTLPINDGDSGQFLQTDGSGNTSWVTALDASSRIIQGNTRAEVIDTGADGYFFVVTEGIERFKVTSDGGTVVASLAAAPSALDGMIYYNSVSDKFEFSENGTWNELGGTLNTSYHYGPSGTGRTITVDEGAVTLNASGAEAIHIDGYIGLVEKASAPNPLANTGLVYTKDKDGVAELYYMDTNGVVTQLTDNGAVPGFNKIQEGNTVAEVHDTGADGYFYVTTEGTERFRVGPAGSATFTPVVNNDFTVNTSGTGMSVFGTGIRVGTTSDTTAGNIRWTGTAFEGRTGSEWINLGILDVNRIVEGNTKAEVHDTGSDGYFFVSNEGAEKMRVATDGKVGIMNTSPSALLTLGTAGTTAGTMSLAGATSGVVTLDVAAEAGTWTITLPTGNGSSSQFLQTDGSGNTSWASAVTAAAGSDHQVQFNNGGAFGGCSNLYWDHTNERLGLGVSSPTSALHIQKENDNAYLYLATYSNSHTNYYDSYRVRGTVSSPAAVQTNDRLVYFGAGAYTGTTGTNAADISIWAAENWSDSAQGAYVTFKTKIIGGTTAAERMRITGTGTLQVGLATGVTGQIDFAGTTSGKVSLKVADVAGTWTMTLPTDDGTSSQFLQTDGNGVCSWASAVTAAAGSDHQIQFNNGGAFGGAATMYWDHANNLLSIGTSTNAISIEGTSYTQPLTVSYEYPGTGNQYPGIMNLGYASSPVFTALRANGTESSKTAVATNDLLGCLLYDGWDGGASPTFVRAAGVYSFVDGTVSEDVVPGRLVFYTRNTSGSYAERIRIASDGKLGLANTSPSALLTLGTAGTTAGTMSLAGATSGVVTVDVAAEAGTWTLTLPINDGDSGQFLQTDGSGNTSWVAAINVSDKIIEGNTKAEVRDTGSDGYFYVSTEGTEKMRVTPTGYVGIGCTDPDKLLDISADATAGFGLNAFGSGQVPFVALRHANGTRASKSAITDGNDLGWYAWNGWYDGSNEVITSLIKSIASESWNAGTYGSHMTFYTTNVTTRAERMRITNDGKVGIMNTAPSALLTLGTAGTTAGSISLAGATSGAVGVDVAAEAGSWTLTLPITGGSSGQILSTDGSGNTSWIEASGTLNTAYHYGASGTGRTITVDEGAVTLNASGAEALHADGYLGLKEIAAPAALVNTGLIYAGDVAGITELFYMDSTGTYVQITDDGYLATANSLYQVGLYTKSWDPEPNFGEGFMYTKWVGTESNKHTELYFMDDLSNVTQITDNGSLNVVMQSPNGAKFKLAVDDDGNLFTKKL